MMCETQENINEFHYLKVPFSFFRNNHDRFDIRQDGALFDLRLSGKSHNWLADERSDQLNFSAFEQ